MAPMAPVMGGDEDVPPGCPRARDDERVVALNALLQMDSERALPLLERVLQRRDQCSATLRRRAVFLVAQKAGPQREELLLKSIREDPDAEVRSQAVFWLAETKSPRATAILEELLRTSTDDRLRDRALFALHNQDSPRAVQILRDYAARADAPRNLRERAIFWLGQGSSQADATFLRELYGRLEDRQLKERVLFSLAQTEGVGNERWLMQIARDQKEPAELRGRALFWLGQGDLLPTSELGALYDQLEGTQVKEQLIFALAQREKDSVAVDRLMAIARKDPDRRLRERAIFWLGQSEDPRVAAFLLELIDR
jgi:HEAT repeat protein